MQLLPVVGTMYYHQIKFKLLCNISSYFIFVWNQYKCIIIKSIFMNILSYPYPLVFSSDSLCLTCRCPSGNRRVSTMLNRYIHNKALYSCQLYVKSIWGTRSLPICINRLKDNPSLLNKYFFFWTEWEILFCKVW